MVVTKSITLNDSKRAHEPVLAIFYKAESCNYVDKRVANHVSRTVRYKITFKNDLVAITLEQIQRALVNRLLRCKNGEYESLL